MASKRRPIRTQQPATNNFRPNAPDVSRSEAKGRKPTASPSSVMEVLVMAIIHVCKKTIFFDTNKKVLVYLGSLLIISLLADFLPFPKTYFARSDNIFNMYFVKIGWGWTLTLSVPFLVMTSYTLCCGDVQKMVKHHLPRIVLATFFWFFWTKLFNVIETSYGRCTVKGFGSKSTCLKAGHFWKGFDISGHAFILIHSSLVLIEEARPIVKWETIKDHIRNELHNRSIAEHSITNPLRNLTDDEMKKLNILYEKFTPAIRTLFIGMSALQMLWDVMLFCTMLYYHRMIEKVLSGFIAIVTWFITYRLWYPSVITMPDPAGSGNFFYQSNNKPDSLISKRAPSLTRPGPSTSAGQVPKFMGNPIYTNYRPQQTNPNATFNVSTDLTT